MDTNKDIKKIIQELYLLDRKIQAGEKIEKTTVCSDAVKALEKAFSIQHEPIKIQSKEKTDDRTHGMIKKRMKIMKPLKSIYKEYQGKVYVTGFGVGYNTDMPCILQIDQKSIDNSLGDYFAYELLELRNGSCIAKIDVSCIILKTWPNKFLCKDVTKKINRMIENSNEFDGIE